MGRPLLHGGYSTKPSGELLKGRARKRLRQYLSKFRAQLVEDLAGSEENLTAAQTVLIDRATAKLTLIRMVELFILETGPFEEPGKLKPVLIGPYMTFTHELRADLQALGLERRTVEKVLTPAELVEVIEAEEAAKEKVDEGGHRKAGT